MCVSILLVEDNSRLAASLSKGLAEAGFVVDVARTGSAALERLARQDADAVILDLGLPDVDGLDVLTRARADGVVAPVLVLTARDAVQSRVDALDRGADDYLVKPFAFEELLARLRALVRRAAGPRWSPLSYGDLRIDPERQQVLIAGQPVRLSPRERALLHYLLRRGGDVASRTEILGEVFGYDFDPDTNLVEVHVAHLRRKIAGARTKIQTVRGTGYRLGTEDDDGDR